MRLPFIGPSYKGRSATINGQECVNFFLEFYGPKEEAKTTKALIPTPGLKPFATSATDSPVRGLYTTSTGRLFAVIGKKLYEYRSTGLEIERGTLLTSSGQVSFADCGNGIARGLGMILVDGSYGYVLNLSSNSFQQIKDPAFPTTSSVIFLNGYFIVNQVNSGRFWLSNVLNGMDWGDVQITVTSNSTINTALGVVTLLTDPALDLSNLTYMVLSSGYSTLTATIMSYNGLTGDLTVNVTSVEGTGSYNNWILQFYSGSTAWATAESSSDNIQTIASIHGELWLVGTQTTEVWASVSNTTGFPFQRLNGGIINNGTVARNSVNTNGSNIFWLGSSAQGHGQVWMSDGYQPTKISTPAIDYMIEAIDSVIEDAIGWCYTQEGHNFYILSFPTANRTFCFDLASQEWHERGYWNDPLGQFDCHRAYTSAFCFDKVYVGDRELGKIYELSLDTYTDDGAIVRRVRTGSHIHEDRKRVSFKSFELDVERGQGLDGQTSDYGTGKDPQVMLQWSDDGGMTWGNEYWKSLGKIGEYKKRIIWHRLGMSRDRMFRVTTSDPTKIILVDARADMTVSGW